jgi:deoxyribodipyrimidine photolyase
MRTLVWFRGKDLRVDDHAPLSDAVRDGEVIPLFVLDPFFFRPGARANFPTACSSCWSRCRSFPQRSRRWVRGW